jgi:hypothetical protein
MTGQTMPRAGKLMLNMHLGHVGRRIAPSVTALGASGRRVGILLVTTLIPIMITFFGFSAFSG